MNNNLKNIKYLKFHNNCSKSCTILFLFNVGSINEDDTNYGISHFIEHMLFKGTTNIPKSSVLLKKIDSYGSNYNAFTTNNITGYHIQIMKQYQLDVFKLLYDMLFNSIFNEDEIEIERKVIKEEYIKDSNDISSITDELIMDTVFRGTNYQHPVIGYLKNINKINRKDMLKYWKKYYTKENCVIVLNGNIEKELIQHIDSIQIKNSPMIYKSHSLKETQHYKFKFKNDNHTDQTILSVCFKTLGLKDNNRYSYDLITNILGGNMSSKLFMSLREKYGLIYDLNCNSHNFKDVGYIEIHCSFDNKNFEKTFQYLFEEIKHLKYNYLNHKEIKDNINFVSSNIIMSQEDAISFSENIGNEYLLTGKINNSINKIKEYNKIDKYNIQKTCYNLFKNENMSIVIIGKQNKIRIKSFIDDIINKL